VSRTPIREALRRLSEEGLVVGVPNRGAVVRTVTLEEAEHVYAVREPLEVLAARLAARRCTPRQVAELEGCLVRAERAAALGDRRTVILENNAFHDLIARASGNPVLTRMLDLLRNQVNLVRMALWARMPARPQETLRQHRRILEALRSGDPEAAAAAARAHLQSSWQSLRRALREEGVR
jgi:DNA-binding GntR family transcriptional regulator